MKIFFATKHSCGDTFFSDLLWLWNNQNRTEQIESPYIAVDEKMDLPDYTKLLLSTVKEE